MTFKKKEYLAKHMKLKYAEIDLARESEKDIPGPSCSQKDDSDSGSDWDEDPEVQLEDIPKDKETPADVWTCLQKKALRPVLYRVLVKSSEEVRPGSVPGSVTVETQRILSQVVWQTRVPRQLAT